MSRHRGLLGPCVVKWEEDHGWLLSRGKNYLQYFKTVGPATNVSLATWWTICRNLFYNNADIKWHIYLTYCKDVICTYAKAQTYRSVQVWLDFDEVVYIRKIITSAYISFSVKHTHACACWKLRLIMFVVKYNESRSHFLLRLSCKVGGKSEINFSRQTQVDWGASFGWRWCGARLSDSRIVHHTTC